MKNYQVIYYNYTGQFYGNFYVLAKDEEDARRLFSLMYPNHGIEDITEYTTPKIFTEEEILKILEKNK